ncbi:hypothetical protein E6W17_41625 [Streptomyces sp. A1547]|nr:hypothetical protein E6W17_41625 [Streptomyces sp. A1547]
MTGYGCLPGSLSVVNAMIGCMGALFGYYAAADDEDAARAVVRQDGQPMGTGYDSFVVKGVDPVVRASYPSSHTRDSGR